MIDRFKNGHKGNEYCHASVLSRKRKKTIPSSQTDNSKKYAWDAPGYCSRRIEGDDESNEQAHLTKK